MDSSNTISSGYNPELQKGKWPKNNQGSHHFRNDYSKSNIKQTINKLKSRYAEINASEVKNFKDFPLSKLTLNGLSDSKYFVPTEIQQHVIGPALQGRDILAAAKTGSGKTLAFLIPVMERLFAERWTSVDGLCALIITPTRELALQIFEMLRRVGRYHDFSAGLIIGGKDLKFERNRVGSVNIVICTPGRLLQHMDETPSFDSSSLKILVLDEADRCMDLGFEETMNAIIDNLPRERQTLLFSATQTKNMRDLVRLSLKDPMYISLYQHEKHKTPEGLIQSYIVCQQHEKFSILWSFINNHKTKKMLVFLSTCHQVKYFYELMRQLRLNVTVMALHGRLHQLKRMDVYNSFCRKKSGILLATDIAARGLDFPEVHWVVQMDCPEDLKTYIHRAGRTARYFKGGESLLILCPTETAFVKYLDDSQIKIEEIQVNPTKLFNPQAKIEEILARHVELKRMAQRAFVTYVKSVYFMKDKSVFDVKSINFELFARSLGMVVTPRLRFLNRKEKELQKTSVSVSSDVFNHQPDESESETEEQIPSGNKFMSDESDGDDVLSIKRVNHQLSAQEEEEIKNEVQIVSKKKKKPITPAAIAKKMLKKKILPNKKVVFSEEGDVVLNNLKEKNTELGKKYENESDYSGIDINNVKEIMKEEDKCDKRIAREKLKLQRRKEKLERKKKMGILPKQKEEEEFSESEGESSGPDLSWLPDPDKVFGKKETDEDNDSDEGPSKKARLASGSYEESQESDIEDLSNEEELALKLLQASSR